MMLVILDYIILLPKEFTRNRKTGGYFRVDNSVGDKVEIIISDIQSYLYAMRIC